MLDIVSNIMKYRSLIGALALRDLQSRYIGTMGGALWSIIQPASTVAVFYFVFSVGFKAAAPAGSPFIMWFIAGLMVWFYFNETLITITGSVTGNAHLIKKTVFPTEILPFVFITAGIVPHMIFMIFVIGMQIWYDIPFSPMRLLVVYFMLCNATLLLGLGWLFSALQVFYRDIAQALSVILNVLFWLTPIVWSMELLPENYRHLLSYNPIYYIVEGYRGLLIFPEPKLPNLTDTVFFWCVTISILFFGAYIFRRLKPEFADML